MATMISPGVYTKITDLSEYLSSTPGTVGFVPILCEQGPDNVLVKINSNEQFIRTFGQPNYNTFGKSFGQGPYIATQHLSVSSDLYTIRALPDDATYAHIYLALANIQNGHTEYDPSDGTSTFVADDSRVGLVSFTSPIAKVQMNNTQVIDSLFTAPMGNYVSSLVSIDETKSDTLRVSLYNGGVPGNEYKSVLLCIRAVGRGDFYNKLSIRIEAANTQEQFGIYNFQLYTKDSSGNDIISESYYVSFNPEAVDASGDSLYIESVINRYSNAVVCKVSKEAHDTLTAAELEYYMNDATLPSEYVAEFADPSSEPGYRYANILEKTQIYNEAVAKEEQAYGLLVLARNSISTPLTDEQKAVFLAFDSSFVVSDFLEDNYDTLVKKAIDCLTSSKSETATAATALSIAKSRYLLNMTDSDFNSDNGLSNFSFNGGSLGSIITINDKTGIKTINAKKTIQVLNYSYSGLLLNPVYPIKVVVDGDGNENISYKAKYSDDVYNLDWIYFSLVYDAGYPQDVKESARILADVYRRDCLVISDVGDNMDIDDVRSYVGAVPAANSAIWNTYLASRYEPYNKIYDSYTGKDQWFSPVYHMARLIPQMDLLWNIWYAPAGFNRAVISDIKELRWSANKGQRDDLYMMRVNPIVYFPDGMTVFGQLTTQKKSSALSDINVVRMVLYVKRAIEQYLKYYIFEFNDQPEWDNISKNISMFLDTVKAARGLRNFSVEVGANEYELKTKTCHVNVSLEPMKVIEKISLGLYING